MLSLLAVVAGVVVLVPGPQAQALTDRWAAWAPVTGRSNDYATTMRQRARGFPEARVASDSRSNVQLAGGTSTFLGAGTPPGAKYGSSRGSSYLVLRPRADTPLEPSRTTYAFDAPTPDTGWAFVLGDVDADQVRIRATDEDGDEVAAAEIDTWFAGAFNYAGETDLPTWHAARSTLEGNAAAADTDGAAGWFEPDIRLTSLTLVFTRRAGFPVYQTWFVSRARPVGGVVDDVTAAGAPCPISRAVLTLLSPSGAELATTSPAADGSYGFGEVATQAGYVVRVEPPATCAAVGPVELSVSNRGNDDDPASRADFDLRRIVPQAISGTVRDTDRTPVGGVELTLTRPDGTTATTTTASDGSYLFDDNPSGTGYSVTLAVPPGYAPGPGGVSVDGITVASTPVARQDLVLRQLPSVTGTVTGGGNPLGGVAVTLRPIGGGPPLHTVTTGDGRYSFAGVPAGDYAIAVDAPPGYGGEPGSRVRVAAADVVRDVELTRRGALGGAVTDAETGEPVAGVDITVEGPGPAREVQTDEEGRFFVDALPPGAYDVVPTPRDGQVAEPTRRTTSITSAGEVRGGLNFAVAAAGPEPTPTSTPTATPTGEPTGTPTPTPTPTPTASPSNAPTDAPGGTDDAAGDAGGLPNTGGPPWWPTVAGAALVLAGAWLMVVGRRRRSET